MNNTKMQPNWQPLKSRLGSAAEVLLEDWMWMYRLEGREYYKHVETRRYLVMDQDGYCYDRNMRPSTFAVEYRKATE